MTRRKAVSAEASYPLQITLGTIAQSLMQARPIGELASQLNALSRRPHNYRNFIMSVVDPAVIQELGRLLARVAEGENARLLFGQHKRTKPKRRDMHHMVALAYWAFRASHAKANIERAADAARKVDPKAAELSLSTIQRYAGNHSDWALQFMSLPQEWIQLRNGHSIKMPSPRQLQHLRDYLRTKSKR